MPAVSVQCPHCSTSYSVDSSLAGRKGRCKNCGKSFALTPSGELVGTAPTSCDEPASGPQPGSWSSTTPLPERIGRFLVRERLGAGACGTVYRAFDPTLDREVALKVPHAEFQRDQKAISRFLREAKAAARLHHPHIVTVFEAGTDGETSYIASAFITGRSLAHAIDDGPFEPRRAARIIAALADGLHAAHQQGIVHRDVKPANVLLDSDDLPHLADFGLARLVADGAKLTKVGSILGTPAYLAPEQAQGKSDQAEPASDQYSLGATLYELLCGEVPFAGPLEVVLFNTLHTPPPPLREDHPDIPAELELICLKTLSKKPDERYSSCRELARDLGNWLAGRPVSLEVPATPAYSSTVEATRQAPASGLPVPEERGSNGPTTMPLVPPMTTGDSGRLTGWLRRNRMLAGLSAGLLVSSMLVGAWLMRSLRKSDPITTKVAAGTSRAVGQDARATANQGPIQPPAPPAANQPAEKAPDPKQDVPALALNDTVRPAADQAKAAAQSAAKPTGTSSVSSAKSEPKPDPALKLPYGDRVQAAYEACLENQGERARTLLASCPAELRGWEWYYCQRMSRGGMITIPGKCKAVSAFAFSPDGKLIAFSGDLTIKIWDGRQVKKLGDHNDVVGISFTGDGKRFVSVGADNMVKEWEVASGSAVRSFELPFPNVSCAAISSDARWVAAGNRSGTVKVWDASTQKEVASRKLRQSRILNLAFSADGAKIIAADREGVYAFDSRKSKTEPIFRKLASPSSVGIGPDGRQYAGAVGRDVWTWDLETKINNPALDGHEGFVRSIAYSHDGKRFATGGLDRTVQVWDAATRRLEGSFQGHTGEVTSIRFSPDGQSVAASSRDGTLRVWKIRAERSEKDLDFGSFKLATVSIGPTVSLQGDAFEGVTFSDDGKRIQYVFGAQQFRNYLMVIDSNSLASVARYADVVGLSPRLDKIALLNSGGIVISDVRGKRLSRCNIDPSLLVHEKPIAIHSIAEMIVLDDNTYLLNIKRSEETWKIYLGVWSDATGKWEWLQPGTISGWLQDSTGRTVDTINDDFSSASIIPRSGNFIGVQSHKLHQVGVAPPKEWNHTIVIRDIQTGTKLWERPGESFRTHPNGDLLAVVAKGTVEIWSVKENTKIGTFDGEQCSFEASGKLVAIRTKDTATIWELRTKLKKSEFKVGSTVAFSPDGRRVVASLGNEVLIVDPMSGKVLLKLRGKSDYFVFSPDGLTIASAMGKLVRFWVADPPEPGTDGS